MKERYTMNSEITTNSLAVLKEHVAEQKKLVPLHEELSIIVPSVTAAIPSWSDITVDQVIRDAMEAVRHNPFLSKCNRSSVFAAVVTAAQLGLRPHVEGQAYLVPFKDWKTKEYNAQLIVGYRGYIALAYRSCLVSSIQSHIAYSDDKFDVDLGSNLKITHKPALRASKDRKPDFAYAVATGLSGSTIAAEYMPIEDVDAIGRKHSQCRDAKNNHESCRCPWNQHRDIMRRKTLVRALAKWLPTKPGHTSSPLTAAIEHDDAVIMEQTPTTHRDIKALIAAHTDN